MSIDLSKVYNIEKEKLELVVGAQDEFGLREVKVLAKTNLVKRAGVLYINNENEVRCIDGMGLISKLDVDKMKRMIDMIGNKLDLESYEQKEKAVS